jgi:hypothetical protein
MRSGGTFVPGHILRGSVRVIITEGHIARRHRHFAYRRNEAPRPGGTNANSPAFQRRVAERRDQSPVGTADHMSHTYVSELMHVSDLARMARIRVRNDTVASRRDDC